MNPAPIALLATLALAAAPFSAAAETVTGRPAIIDGDTIEISGKHIRLHGIDAPELGQACLRDGNSWACGQEAMFALAALVEHHWVDCEGRTRDPCGRLVAICTMGGPKGVNLGQQMVADGWAIADQERDPDYVEAEISASAAKRNLWQSTFQPPWEWRRAHRAETPAAQCNHGR
jgi:endonuclease YncB( thermonuclease family)